MKFKGFALFFLFIAFLFINSLSAQKAPIKWGKASQEDLDMKVYPLDTSAAAVVLVDYGHLRFDFAGSETRYIFHRHRRIKVLRRSAFSEGDITIPYYGDDYITSLKGQIINPDGSKQVIKKSEIFDEKVTDTKKAIKFTFPNLQEGSIIEYEYDLYSPYYFQLEQWFFQDDIPTRWSEYRLEVPERFDYVVLNQGREFDIKDITYEFKNIHFPGAETVKTKLQISRYVMENVPALKEENYVTTMADYLARLRFQLSSFNLPDQAHEPVLSTWPKVAEELRSHNNFGQQILKRRNFKSLSQSIQPLLVHATNDAEKVHIIYQALAEQIEWNGQYSYLTKDNLDDCFERKEANSTELNLMLIALLKEQNIPAYPVLISTRSHGKMIQVYPILSQFNHTLALVELEGKSTIVDVSSPYRPIGLPRVEALNGMGWLVDEENSQWIPIDPPKNSEGGMVTLEIGEYGNLKGSYNRRFKGYGAVSHRKKIEEDKEEGLFIKKSLTEQYPDIKVESVIFENVDDLQKPLAEKIIFELPYGVQEAGDFLYLSPVLFPIFDENPLKAEARAYPVNIPYPSVEQYVVVFNLPEGYIIEETPESTKIDLPNQGGSFTYSVKILEDNIQINSLLKINQLIYSPEEYPIIKSFFDMIIEKQEEQIVLKKKT